MGGFIKAASLGLPLFIGLIAVPVLARVLPQSRPAAVTPVNDAADARATPSGIVTPTADPAALGRSVLNAGPDPYVRLDGLSYDHAAMFGTEDEDEQALLDNEQALQRQRDYLHRLERLLVNEPPTMIRLNPRSSMRMAPLAPTPSGSQLGGGEAQRSVDRMQRRVDDLRGRVK